MGFEADFLKPKKNHNICRSPQKGVYLRRNSGTVSSSSKIRGYFAYTLLHTPASGIPLLGLRQKKETTLKVIDISIKTKSCIAFTASLYVCILFSNLHLNVL